MSINQLYTPNWKPNVHQSKAINQMLLNRCANFDEQGLGKTKQAYDLAAKLTASRTISLTLFIVKASLRENIHREIQRDAYQLSPMIVRGNRLQRNQTYRYLHGNVLILSYETAISDQETLIELIRKNKALVCYDESHYLKNINSVRTRACIGISSGALKSLIFSGTPIPNRVEDIFPQLKILGFPVGETVQDFKKMYPSAESIKELLKGKFIRRRKTEVKDLKIPTKKVRRITTSLSGTQRQLYDELSDQLVDSLKKLKLKRTFLPISNVCTKLLRLNQLASNPGLIYDGYLEIPGKIRQLDKILKGLKRSEKVIIWTSYRQNVSYLASRYQSYGVTKLFGGLKRTERDGNVNRFMNDPTCQILVATPQCAREGFTLTAASTAIYLDRSFSYLDWSQSQDRIHRISQTKPCDVIVLEAGNTVDQHIDSILQKKSELQSYLLGESDQGANISQMSVDSLIKILARK